MSAQRDAFGYTRSWPVSKGGVLRYHSTLVELDQWLSENRLNATDFFNAAFRQLRQESPNASPLTLDVLDVIGFSRRRKVLRSMREPSTTSVGSQPSLAQMVRASYRAVKDREAVYGLQQALMMSITGLHPVIWCVAADWWELIEPVASANVKAEVFQLWGWLMTQPAVHRELVLAFAEESAK